MMPSGSAGGGSPGASNTSIKDCQTIEIHNHYHFHGEVTAQDILFAHSIQDTEKNSKPPPPPPLCYPGTCISITTAIFEWMRNLSRTHNILWLFGFAGVGKSTIAQTVAEQAESENILGATFFYLRQTSHDITGKFITSIAYQLAVRNEEYRHHVTQVLRADRGLFAKNMETQFRKLIVEPLSSLKCEQKLLIIVDGLEECKDIDTQHRIINLITSTTKLEPPPPVIWMICSRPTFEISYLFKADGMKRHCWQMELHYDPEAYQDIEVFLQARFDNIATRYRIKDWPSPDHLRKLVCAAPGVFSYADAVLRYIDNRAIADPKTKLAEVIKSIDSPETSTAINPFYHLDRLYMSVMKVLPPHQLRYALQLIGISAIYPNCLTILELANILGISRDDFSETAFRKLNSVVKLTSDRLDLARLEVRHASFLEFLKDPNRSGEFCINLEELNALFATRCFGVISQTTLQLAKNLSWEPKRDKSPAFTVANDMLAICAKYVWQACYNHGDALDTDLLHQVVEYRYSLLRFIGDKVAGEEFQKWSEWLVRQIRLHNLENIIQPVEWNDEYLRNIFGSHIPDGVENKSDVSAFILGATSKRVKVIIIKSLDVYFLDA